MSNELLYISFQVICITTFFFRKRTLESKSNLMMVDLLPLELPDDLNFVECLLKEFYEKTGSAVAQRILSNWPASAKSFTKVCCFL